MGNTAEIYGYASQSPWHYAKYRLLTKGKDWHGVFTPDDVQAMWDRQKGLCAYTGWSMSYAPNSINLMSIDHIVPLSRGGLSVPSNAQLVCWPVNRIKTNMLHGIFVSLCQAVAEHAPFEPNPDDIYDAWRERTIDWR